MKKQVLVIGGGIVGTSVARELQANGSQVLLIDRGEAGQGCSFGNAGWITPCFAMPLPQPGMLLKSIGWLLDSESPLHIKPSFDPVLFRWLWHFNLSMNRRKMLRSIAVLTDISKHSFEFYAQLAKRTKIPVHFETNGLLMVSSTSSGIKYARDEMNLMSEREIRGQMMERDELLSFEPMLKPLVKGGVFFPDEAQAEPFNMVQAILEEFTSLGGEFRKNIEVFDFVVSGQRRIEEVITTKGRFQPDLVVLATGSWSPEVARQLDIRVPMLGGKGYSMSLENPKAKPKRSIMIVERKIAVTPRQSSIRLAGTLELVNQDFSISPNRVQSIVKGAHEFLKIDNEAPPTDIWRGLRPCTPDGVPLIGFSERISNLFFCTGHQMLGLQSAPGSARLAAELINGKTPFTDPKPFRPDRY